MRLFLAGKIDLLCCIVLSTVMNTILYLMYNKFHFKCWRSANGMQCKLLKFDKCFLIFLHDSVKCIGVQPFSFVMGLMMIVGV